jgi:hypothetical protein
VTPLSQEIPIDGGDLFDSAPPRFVVIDPLLGGRHEVGGQRDLLCAPSGMSHTQIGDAMPISRGAVAAWLSAPQRSLNDAASQNLFQRRKLLHCTLMSGAEGVSLVSHTLRLYSRKTMKRQALFSTVSHLLRFLLVGARLN